MHCHFEQSSLTKLSGGRHPPARDLQASAALLVVWAKVCSDRGKGRVWE